MKTAFLDMSNHLTITKSGHFFIDLLREFFGDVAVIPHERVWVDVPKTSWDLIVVWQKRYTPRELRALGADRVVLVPMYDDIPLDEEYWNDYREFRIFCFSSTLERLLVSYGLNAWGVRYYPQPPSVDLDWSSLRAFFWPRTRAIDWQLVKTLMDGTEFSRVNLHWTPKLNENSPQPLSAEERSSGRIKVSTWFGSMEEYHALLSESNVFFAPRRTEGIGMAFIEAMAMGLCVAAPDQPTMNEYIEDGVTGLLYDPDRPARLDFSRARALGAAARASCAAGRKRWLESLPRIRAFLEAPMPDLRPQPDPIIVAKGRALYAMRRVPGLQATYRALRRAARR